MTKSKQLIFFGSGPVGLATLKALIAAGYQIEAVITKPKPAHHRGAMPVLDFTTHTKNMTVYTPANEKELSELFASNKFASALALVVDYGIKLSKNVLDHFQLGAVNSHFSLLPQWRGADPISFAILSGQAKTGVSLMLLDEALDEGPLLAQQELAINPAETTPHLTQRLIQLSNEMLIKYLPRYFAGDLKPFPQPKRPPTYSRRLTKADGVVDWAKPAEQIEREVRAYGGWPKSRAEIYDADVILTKVRVAENEADGDLVRKTGEGWLEIQELIAPSGRTMSGADFLRGYSPPKNN